MWCGGIIIGVRIGGELLEVGIFGVVGIEEWLGVEWLGWDGRGIGV